jgi:nucleotide-binding universal stress UspA family protein
MRDGRNKVEVHFIMATTLVFIDFSSATPAVVRVARDVARALGMKLVLMHVSTPDTDAEGLRLRKDVSRPAVAAEMHRYHRELELLAMGCTKLGADASALLVRGQSTRGNPVPKMLRELKRVNPALIIMGTHQHGRFFEALYGTASSKVVHKASCPILLVPGYDHPLKWLKSGARPAR